MNLFKKIFNYQVISRLDESGTVMMTTHERAWLKTMLTHPDTVHAFTFDTREKLENLLQSEDVLQISDCFAEKAKIEERHVYHPFLRPLRRIIMKRQGIRISFSNKQGRYFDNQLGFPYKLEFSMVKKEWYLLWYHLRYQTLMTTRLQSIQSVQKIAFHSVQSAELMAKIESTLASRKEHVVIEVVPSYHKELSRILYAFSCFEKDVKYISGSDTYRISVFYLSDDSEYVLSKIRFLGKRIKVIENEKFKLRMLETSKKALLRYGISTT